MSERFERIVQFIREIPMSDQVREGRRECKRGRHARKAYEKEQKRIQKDIEGKIHYVLMSDGKKYKVIHEDRSGCYSRFDELSIIELADGQRRNVNLGMGEQHIYE